MHRDRDRVLGQLEGRGRIYAVLDGARDPRVARLVAGGSAPSWCLYRGNFPQTLADVAPHLLHLRPGHDYADTFFRVGWRNLWGILLAAAAPQPQIYRQLRRFLRVRTEEGRVLVFRYYDPRILRRYLPTCTAAEMERFFGPIAALVAEANDEAQFHLFRRSEAGFEHLLVEGDAPPRVVQTWPRAEAAALRGPVVVRGAQLEALADPTARAYEDGMVAWIADAFPAHFERRDEEGVRALVRRGLGVARTYRLTRNADVTGLLSLMLLLGEDFETREKYRWIGDLLRSDTVASTDKIKTILAQLAAD
jgi:hypothetical protein